jgi:hypothetical protein
MVLGRSQCASRARHRRAFDKLRERQVDRCNEMRAIRAIIIWDLVTGAPRQRLAAPF